MRHALLFGIGVLVVCGTHSIGIKSAPLQKRAPNDRSWPTFGGTPSRNMVNLRERDLPTDWSFDPDKPRNIKWVANLGRNTFSTPVVAEGMVFIGTNKPLPPSRDDRAVLMAFRESDGKLVWENAHDAHLKANKDGEQVNLGPFGMACTPTVAGSFVYYVTPTCEVICAKIGDGTIAWRYDMVNELRVSPAVPWCIPLSNISSPLVIGDRLFLGTGHGIDSLGNLANSAAPSFIALHRDTGKVIWQNNLPGKNIIEGQRSSAVFAEVDGRTQVIFAGGDAVIYSFAPETGDLLWKCDCLPFRQLRQKPPPVRGKEKLPIQEQDCYFLSTPVIVRNRLFVGMGLNPDSLFRANPSYFLCLDLTKKGDVSFKSYDAKDPANKQSALVWAFGGPVEPSPKKGRRVLFGKTLSTAAVHDGLVYITEEIGYMHCLDAKTGQRYWQHDFKENVWSSPYWVDERVFTSTLAGEVVIFAPGRTAKVLEKIEADDSVLSSPMAANGTLYIASRSKLYAISSR